MKYCFRGGLGILFFCYTVLSLAQAQFPIVDDAAQARIDSALDRFVQSGDIAGISALIYEKGQEVYYGAFGYSDNEHEIPMDRNTIVQIFSMTKPVTGVALMQLYEQGKFSMDAPVSKYLPEFTDVMVYAGYENGEVMLEKPKRPITVRDLTRHTAGFHGGGEDSILVALFREANPGSRNITLEEMSNRMATIPLAYHPGDQWRYSFVGDIQARLVEVLSGQPFDEYLYEHVLGPLAMTQTRYVVPPADTHRLAALYRREKDGKLTRLPDSDALSFNTKDWPSKPGGYGLTSTIDDYMRLARMLNGGGTLDGVQILTPEVVKLMATNHLSDTISQRSWLPSKGQVGFGIDFAVRTQPPASENENYGVVGEFFWDGAASTLFWVDPLNDLTAVLFVQLFPFDQIGLHRAFRNAVYGQ